MEIPTPLGAYHPQSPTRGRLRLRRWKSTAYHPQLKRGQKPGARPVHHVANDHHVSGSTKVSLMQILTLVLFQQKKNRAGLAATLSRRFIPRLRIAPHLMEKGRRSTRDDYLFLVVGALELWSCRVVWWVTAVVAPRRRLGRRLTEDERPSGFSAAWTQSSFNDV